MIIGGFKQGAYILLDTPEIRKHLESLGYKHNTRWSTYSGGGIATYPWVSDDGTQDNPEYFTLPIECLDGSLADTVRDWRGISRVNCETDIEKFKKVVSEKI